MDRPPPWREREAHVWRVDATALRADGASLLRLLADDERERATRFHFAVDRHRYTVARSMLRILLGHYLGLRPERVAFKYNEWGKPYLDAQSSDLPLEFNVSHSGDHILVGVCRDHPIGVDIERVDHSRPVLDLARIAFGPAEYAALSARAGTEQSEAFFRVWVRREAYAKAYGRGLTLPAASFEVALDASAAPILRAHDPQTGGIIRDVPAPASYMAAMAVLGADASMQLLDGLAAVRACA